MSLADKVRAEQQAVADGTAGCKADHPYDDVDAVCIRVEHLPHETVHAGFHGDVLIQWEDGS